MSVWAWQSVGCFDLGSGVVSGAAGDRAVLQRRLCRDGRAGGSANEADPAVVERSVQAIFGLYVTPALVRPVIEVMARYSSLKASFPATEMIGKL
jgi:hypothetical protein